MTSNTGIVLVDIANISSGFEKIKKTRGLNEGIKINYNELVRIVTPGIDLIDKIAFVATKMKDTIENRKAQIQFLRYLKKSGFDLRTKEFKAISQLDGSVKFKGNFDVEIGWEISKIVHQKRCDEIILISGDSDFSYPVEQAKENGFIVTVASSIATVSSELRIKANKMFLIDDFVESIAHKKSAVKSA